MNGSVFLSKYNDLQLTLLSCPQYGAGLPCAVVANAGNADMKGVELEVIAHPGDGWTIDASASTLNFKYTYLDPAAGGPGRPTGPQYGMRPAYVPKLKGSIGIQYEFDLASGASITPRLDASYQGEMYASGSNAETNRIGSYALANARLTWRSAMKDWEASAEITNLDNKYYFLTRFDQYTTTGVTDGQPGRPREFALTVKRKF